MSTYNIFEAARKLKIKNIISASSETVLGLPMVNLVVDLGWILQG
jgi:nucleoside-diphosphate-sugar epimerase